MDEALRILILEDMAFDAELEEYELQEAGLRFISKRVMTEKDYIEGLQGFIPHLILSDYDLPQYNGASALAEARRICPDTPFILVTGAIGEDRAIEILTQGAKDYVLKSRLNRLAPAVQRALSEAQAHKARKKAEEELRETHRALECQVEERTAELRAEITTRKQAEASLRQNEEKLRLALEASSQGTWDWNLIDGELIWSDKCKTLYGLAPDAAVSYTLFLSLIHPEDRDRIHDAISQSLEQKADYDVEMRVLWPDGKVRWLASKGHGLYNDNGQAVRMIGVARDITERRLLEEDLMKARKLEAVGTLAGGIAHDFNNLLAIIQGYVELIRLKTPFNSPAQANLSSIDRAITQGSELTKRLITFSIGGDPVRKLCDIREILNETSVIMLDAASLEHKYDLADEIWPIEVDIEQMRQAIRNLIVNAAEAMPEGGTLTIGAGNVIVRRRDLLPVPEGRYVRISVEDTGSGIPENDLPHIFDPYFSTKQRGQQKGMGLGLSVCYSIVSRHKGCISVSSQEGRGSAFHIYIPVQSQEKQTGQALSARRHLQAKGRKKVLVMDDEAMIRDITKQLLTVRGYSVETAADGFDAVDLYAKARDAGDAFDMVFLDLTVKGGLGGVPTLQRLLEIDPGVRAVILTGYSNDPVIDNFEQYGFIGAVAKPFTSDKLTHVIESLLSTGGAALR